jgi:putative endonuclease
MGWPRVLGRARTAKQIAGDAAEDLALEYLQQQGLTLVTRNFRCKGGELDLVMQDRADLVFVEVRKRACHNYGSAADSITASKQARLVTAAQIFLQRYRSLPSCRFDVVAIDGARIDWLKNAFDA